MQGYTPRAYPTRQQRPPLPEYRPHLREHRPHTAHMLSSAPVAEEEGADGDVTPRASETHASIEEHLRRRALQHPEGAVGGLFPPPMPRLSAAQKALAPEDRLNTMSEQDRVQYLRQERIQLNAFRMPEMFEAAVDAAADPTADTTAAEPKSTTRSLGRKFSSRYKRGMQAIRQNVYSHTIIPTSRRRGMSFSQGMEGVEYDAAWQAPVPFLPGNTRREGKDNRPKRKWPGVGSDRKDTPAPASYGATEQQHMQTRVDVANRVRTCPTGGERARAAAATYNGSKQPAYLGTWSTSQEDLNKQRGRLGSLSSAADSGTDLTNCGASAADADGDLDMLKIRAASLLVSDRYDPLSYLPEEISLAIFENVDPRSLLRCQRVSSRWACMARMTPVWRAAYLSAFSTPTYTDPAPVQVGGLGLGRPKQPVQEWQKMYKARVQLEQNWRKGSDHAGKATYLAGHTDSVYCLQFDEHKIITGSRDRTIRVWDMHTLKCLKVIGGPTVRPTPGPKVIRCVEYPHFHDAKLSHNGTPYGNSIYHVPREWHDASILCLQYDDTHLVTGSSDSDLIVWDIKTFEPVKRLRKHTGGVLDIALDTRHIVSCSKDSQIIVWDRVTLEPKGVLSGHRGPVNAVQLRGHLLVSASGDGIARLWDLNTMKLTKEFPAKDRGLAAVEFSEDMKHVLAGGNDHITYKFETDTGREVRTFAGHSQLVRSLWLDSTNARVVSGSYDLDLRVYDFASGVELWRGEEWTTSWMLAAKSDYRRIVATSQDGRILIVDFGLHKGGILDGRPVENIDLLRGW